jgi:hypothetical protein
VWSFPANGGHDGNATVKVRRTREFRAYQVREVVLQGDDAEKIAYLEQVATAPSEKQKLFSAAVAEVNEKYKALIAAFPKRQREHWLMAFAWWAGGTLLLFGAGLTVRWVYRGFRSGGAEEE